MGDPQAVRTQVAKEPCDVVLSLASGDSGWAWVWAYGWERCFPSSKETLQYNTAETWLVRIEPKLMPKGRD